jgi:glycine/D-amino acid oxidase-like deaminating enzyme
MEQAVYWHSTVDMPSDRELTPLPPKVDVAVIGGGYTGLSAARALARRRASVAVLEAETIGWGASSRNGGMVLTGLKVPMLSVIQRYGRKLARQLFQCSLDSIATVEEIIREEGIDCGFTRTGHLLVANKLQHFQALQKQAEFLEKEFDHTVRLVPPERLSDEIGSGAYHGALVDEVSGGLNPARFVVGLARAAEKAGASLCPRARVERVLRLARSTGGPGFLLETRRGQLFAGRVLVATSGYTRRATAALQRRIIPIGSFIIATEKLPESLTRELSPKNRMIFDSKHFLNYFRLWEGRMIFGGRAAFFPENERTIRRSAEILRREMVQVFPQLKDASIEYAWGGTLDFAFDMMAHTGELDGLAYALGYAGHGVALGTYLGKTVAEAMLDDTLKDHPFAAYNFPGAPLGLYTGSPWFLPLAGLWYRLLDLIE